MGRKPQTNHGDNKMSKPIAYLDLIRFAFSEGEKIQGYNYDSDEWEKLTSYKDAKEFIEAWDTEAMVNIAGGNFLIINDYDSEPEETICDYHITDFAKKWEEQYY